MKAEPILGQATEVSKEEGHTIRIRTEKDSFVVQSDGNWVSTVFDGTFPNAGRIVLWTKAGAAPLAMIFHLKTMSSRTCLKSAFGEHRSFPVPSI